MKRVHKFLEISAILFVLYIIVNLVHLTWSFVSPEGIWSFWLFTDVLRVVLISVVVFIAFLFFLYYFIKSIYVSFTEGFQLKKFKEAIYVFIICVFSTVFNVLFGLGPSIFLNKKMSDKYSYLNRTEKLLNQGEFKKAEDEAYMAYNKLQNQDELVSQFFILSNLAQKNGYIFTPSLEEKYGIIVNYAYCIQKIRNDLSKAKILYEKAILLIEHENLSEIDEFKIFPLLQISEIELQRRNYSEAEDLFTEIKKLGEKVEGDEFMLYYFTVYGRHSQKFGDHFKASQLFTEAYDYYLTTDFPIESAMFRSIAIKAVDSHLALGNLEKAGEILVNLIPQMRKRKDREEYLRFLNVRAMYCLLSVQSDKGNIEVLDRGYFRKGLDWINPNYDPKKSLINKSLDDLKNVNTITKKKEGEKSVSYASSLNSVGRVFELLGNHREAKSYYTQAKAIIKEFEDVDYEVLHQSNLNISRVDFMLGNNNDSQKRLAEIDEYIFSKIRGTFPFLSEYEREKFVIAQDYGLRFSNAIYTLTDNKKHASTIYDNIVASKGLALASNINFRIHLQNHSPQLMEEYLKILQEKEDLIEYEAVNPELIKKSNKVQLQEKEFLNTVEKSFKIELVEVPTNIGHKVKDALDENEVAIEIYSIPTSEDFRDSTYYYGVIIKKDYPEPKIIPLFSERELKSAINVTGGFAYRINQLYGERKPEMLNLLWAKLATEVIGKDKVYLSVSGLMHGIPLPSLLIDQPFDLVLLSSTKNILNKDKLGIEDLATASVFGDPDFTETVYGQYNSSLSKLSAERGSKPTKGTFPKLPHSRAESLRISELLNDKKNTSVHLFLDKEASEANFRNLKKEQTQVLHLATHGFYSENQAKNQNSLFKLGSQSPLLSSGLILAGTVRKIGSNSNDDGIVTAMDISKMNFTETELVVLSACETGLGEIIGSEGVFGMQRAFKIAGAKSVMMSLWKVPDAQTAELMAEFYYNLSQGITLESSLKKAQLKIREMHKDPFFWAGFVLVTA